MHNKKRYRSLECHATDRTVHLPKEQSFEGLITSTHVTVPSLQVSLVLRNSSESERCLRGAYAMHSKVFIRFPNLNINGSVPEWIQTHPNKVRQLNSAFSLIKQSTTVSTFPVHRMHVFMSDAEPIEKEIDSSNLNISFSVVNSGISSTSFGCKYAEEKEC